jgi:hypothetical protein
MGRTYPFCNDNGKKVEKDKFTEVRGAGSTQAKPLDQTQSHSNRGKINQVMQRVSQLCRNKARQPRAKLSQGYFPEKGKADVYIMAKKTPTGFNKRGLVTRKDQESITMSPHEGTRWRTFLAARIALRYLSRGNPFGHHQGLRAWSDVALICGLQSSG